MSISNHDALDVLTTEIRTPIITAPASMQLVVAFMRCNGLPLAFMSGSGLEVLFQLILLLTILMSALGEPPWQPSVVVDAILTSLLQVKISSLTPRSAGCGQELFGLQDLVLVQLRLVKLMLRRTPVHSLMHIG